MSVRGPRSTPVRRLHIGSPIQSPDDDVDTRIVVDSDSHIPHVVQASHIAIACGLLHRIVARGDTKSWSCAGLNDEDHAGGAHHCSVVAEKVTFRRKESGSSLKKV